MFWAKARSSAIILVRSLKAAANDFFGEFVIM